MHKRLVNGLYVPKLLKGERFSPSVVLMLCDVRTQEYCTTSLSSTFLPVQGGFDPSKISGLGVNFGIIVRWLHGANKSGANKTKHYFELNYKRKQSARSPRSFYLFILQIKVSVIRVAHWGQIDDRNRMLGRLRSYFKTKCCMWTWRGRQGLAISES